MSDYPKMLFKAGSAIVWEGFSLDCTTVDDAAAERVATGEGWLTAALVMTAADATVAAPVDAPRRGRPRKVV